LSLKQNKALTI